MSVNRNHTAPVKFPRTRRNHALTILSSLPAGKVVPIAAIPLLREDAVSTGAIRMAFEMHETKEILMNPVHVQVNAYLVPWLALERFEGSRDQFDRSYMGQKKTDDAGATVVPFIEKHAMGAHGSNAVYKALGLHGKPTDQVNTAYLEAYNAIWNLRADNRSKGIAKRTRLQTDLAPAFWPASRFAHIVPDFDQAVIDGEIAMQIISPKLPVKGLSNLAAVTTGAPTANIPHRGGTYPYGMATNATNDHLVYKTDVDGALDVYAEMESSGLSVSLSNIELARKTQAFAKIREKYNGIDDEYIIDMLMQGLEIPDQAMKQPILIAQQITQFGQNKRYATDAANLEESVVSGIAALQMNLRTPRVNTGGVIMVTAEIVPEQLFERQRDPFFHLGTLEDLPDALRDTLDPEKVEVVKNAYIDTDHATPDGTFGYAPLNHAWTSFGPRVGGKFYRPSVNTAFDEERQRLWAVETVNPKLSENFYIVSDIHVKPFVDQTTDPFDVVALGGAVISGNTVFGGLLVEATNDYDQVLAEAPQQRIVK